MGVAQVVLTEPLFIYGPLATPMLLQTVIGDAHVRPAQAPGLAITLCDEPVPVSGLSAGQGNAEGLLISGADAVARLSYLAQVLGLGPVERLVVVQDGTERDVLVFPGRPGRCAWHPQEWVAKSGAILQAAAREIMIVKDRVTAADLADRLPMILSRAGGRVAARQSAPASLRSSTHADQVQDMACEITHVGFFLSRAYTLRHPRFDGTMSATLGREVFVATDAALVLPYDPVRDRVLLVEQFRMGPYGRGDPHPWMLEPVAGRIDGGESPEDAARRECLEEAGLTLRHLEKISAHYCTPGYSTEFFHIFLGVCDLPDTDTGQGGLATEHEDIRTHVIDFERAMALLRTGEANNGPLILSLIWLERERARLRASA
ncbi:ADP-ribose pyrophosphatase [Roseovarius sp. MBR-51]